MFKAQLLTAGELPATQRERVPPVPVKGRAPSGASERELSQLRRELGDTKAHLHAVVDEQETYAEELQAANEEAQASNEELQSINEELETSKEELQATNEELGTIKGYINIPLGQLESRLSEIPKSKLIITACNHGSRAARAVDILEKGHYKTLGACGLAEWKEKNYPLIYPKQSDKK